MKEVFESKSVSPKEMELIDKIRSIAGELDDLFREIGNFVDATSESRRLRSLALTNLEQSVMWAIKAVSRVNP